MSKPSSSEITLAYIGGGSLNWAQVLMSDLIHDGTISGEIRLYDLDRAAAERNAVLGNRLSAAHGVSLRYTVSDSLAEALSGVDFVVISILPGSFECMANDIGLPEKEGIRQSVGDTVGPGGLVRALRAIPSMAEIADAVRTYCPKAFLCNLTNPMSVLTGTLYAVYPEIRAWGECHEVTSFRNFVAAVANAVEPGAAYSVDEVEVNVMGINHFTFVDRIRVREHDWLAPFMEFAEAHRAEGWRKTPMDRNNEQQRFFEDHSRVRFDLMSRFGLAVVSGDRHSAEFLPSGWYLDSVDSWGFGLTPVSWRQHDRAAKQEAARIAEAAAAVPPLRSPSQESLVKQIRALTRGDTLITNANLPNRGQLEGFAPGTIVETNAIFSGLGAQPIYAGRLPPALEPMVQFHANRQNALIAAALENDVQTIEGLFMTDPLVMPLGPDRAAALFRAMCVATIDDLPAPMQVHFV